MNAVLALKETNWDGSEHRLNGVQGSVRIFTLVIAVDQQAVLVDKIYLYNMHRQIIILVKYAKHRHIHVADEHDNTQYHHHYAS